MASRANLSSAPDWKTRRGAGADAKKRRTKPIFLSPEVAVFFRLKVEIRTSAVDRTNPFLASWRKRGPGSGGAAVVAAAETTGADDEEEKLEDAGQGRRDVGHGRGVQDLAHNLVFLG